MKETLSPRFPILPKKNYQSCSYSGTFIAFAIVYTARRSEALTRTGRAGDFPISQRGYQSRRRDQGRPRRRVLGREGLVRRRG